MRALLILLFALGCGKYHGHNSSIDMPRELAEKRDLYLELSKSHQDRYGMFEPVGDSILFSCLYQFAGGADVDALSSFSQLGAPIRHPEVGPEHSATPVSRDMVIGFMYCALSSAEGREIMQRLVNFGQENNWDMCAGAEGYDIDIVLRFSRCVMTPSMVATIYRVASKVGVPCEAVCQVSKLLPYNMPSNVSGFTRHLAFLRVGLEATVSGKIDADTLATMRRHAEAEPRNALYQAMYSRFLDGDQLVAMSILRRTKIFPSDSLPTTANYCTEYLYQRDESPADWEPCPDQVREHPGIDYLFALKWAM